MSRPLVDSHEAQSLTPPCWPRWGYVRLWVWWCALRWFLRPTFWSLFRLYLIAFETFWTGIYYWLQRPGNSKARIDETGLVAVLGAASTALIPSVPIALFFASWWTMRARRADRSGVGNPYRRDEWERDVERATLRLTDARDGVVVARDAGRTGRRRTLVSWAYLVYALIINGVVLWQIGLRVESDHRLFALVPLTALDLLLIDGYRRLLGRDVHSGDDTPAPRAHPHPHEYNDRNSE